MNPFRKICKDSKKITFIGTPGFCTPFANLMAFVIRDSGIEMAFIPNLLVDKARKIVSTPEGSMQLGEIIDPSADTVVVLGGLAMPKIGVDVNKIKTIIDDITSPENRTIIGVCFMSIFEKEGWVDVIDFDHILNSHIKNTIMEK